MTSDTGESGARCKYRRGSDEPCDARASRRFTDRLGFTYDRCDEHHPITGVAAVEVLDAADIGGPT